MSAQASTFSVEANIDILDSEVEDTVVSGTNFAGTYYFKPITISTVPLEESAFVKQTSHAYFEKASIEVEGNVGTIAQETTTMGANFIDNGWLLGGQYQEITVDNPLGLNGASLEIIDYRFGRFFNDWLVGVALVTYESEAESEEAMRYFTKKFGRLAPGISYSVSGQYLVREDLTEMLVKANVYLNKKIVLGGSINTVAFDDGVTEDVDPGQSAFVQYYVTEEISVRAEISERNFTSPGQFDVASKAMKLSAKIRF